MIDRTHKLSITRQARALGISRGVIYYEPRPTPTRDLALMRRIDQLHLEFPFAGARMLRRLLGKHYPEEFPGLGRRHVATVMRQMVAQILEAYSSLTPTEVDYWIKANSTSRVMTGLMAGDPNLFLDRW